MGRVGLRGRALEYSEVLVSELALNAIVHAATPFTVAVDADPDLVRVEVQDGSPDPPRLLERRPEDSAGLGLHMVTGLASAWGWQRTIGARGKAVWAELDLASARGTPASA
jgi:anti-sigma regulatory factor (Ser/Thr protein kinase)